jgi:hypothetical protein
MQCHLQRHEGTVKSIRRETRDFGFVASFFCVVITANSNLKLPCLKSNRTVRLYL